MASGRFNGLISVLGVTVFCAKPDRGCGRSPVEQDNDSEDRGNQKDQERNLTNTLREMIRLRKVGSSDSDMGSHPPLLAARMTTIFLGMNQGFGSITIWTGGRL
ncbi:hypothetical protein PIB30_019266 [Stylosanthes scabra]|uniref:Uncharacterized protein n=1 Tax=Stylosanthes scabra TaxID=79078 RepID=A0ABU6T811_9FABA|nr:hypothetical protein [Stylosanthes scabra]